MLRVRACFKGVKNYVRKLNKTQSAQPDNNREKHREEIEIHRTQERQREQKTKTQLKNNKFFEHTNVLREHFYTSP